MKLVKEKRKSCTELICELTRLKSQQKYLECSQVKLNIKNFPDCERENEQSSSAIVKAQINEIDAIKTKLEENLQNYRQAARAEVQELWTAIKTVKDDVFEPERLLCFPLNGIRQRIISINTQLERLNGKIDSEMERLKTEYAQIEQEVKLIMKEK